MNIFLEYLKRRGVLQTYFKLPCSYFVEHGNSRKVVACHPLPESSDVLIKYWDLDQNYLDAPLPPSTEIKMSLGDIFAGKTLPADYSIVVPDYNFGIPSAMTDDQPMSEVTYDYYYDSILISNQNSKYDWLWESFFQCYGFSCVNVDSLPKSIRIAEEMLAVKQIARRQWQYWEFWKRHMLDFNSEIPIELILISFSSDFA